jgi:ProP effector
MRGSASSMSDLALLQIRGTAHHSSSTIALASVVTNNRISTTNANQKGKLAANMDTKQNPVSATLKRLREHYPIFAQFKPLKLGIHKDLLERQFATLQELRPALTRHTSDSRYLRAIAAGGPRFALDGGAAGEVSEEEKSVASNWIKDGKPRGTNRPSPSITLQNLIMNANSIKVSLVVTDFAQYLDVASIGATAVPITVRSGDSELTAALNPKSFRKAQTTFKALDGAAAVVISGELDVAGKTIKSAGIAVQPKATKP